MDNPYPICENCIFVDVPLNKDPCQECMGAFFSQRIKPNFVSKRKPQTNSDRIRAMTDEELAELLPSKSAWNCPPNTKERGGCRGACVPCWLDWLKQEVNDD